MPNVELLCGDSAAILKSLNAEVFELTVTSPPYDSVRTYKDDLASWNFEKFQDIARELFRVTKAGGTVCWIVNDQYINGGRSLTSFRQALFFQELGFLMHDCMIYQKSNFSFPSNNRYHQIYEFMFILSKGKIKTFNPIMDRPNVYVGQKPHGKWRKKDGDFQPVSENYKDNFAGVSEFGKRYNIWRVVTGGGHATKDKIAHKHPAIFGESLAGDLIHSFSNEGDTILDPFAGSGTTLKVANLMNRNSVGIEIAQDYVEIARERLKI